jgi:hypothetical protein
MGRNLRLQPLVIYHCKGERPTIHRCYLVGIGGHCASGKLRLKKVIFENWFSNFEVIFEFFFEISKTKKLSPITSYYGKNFRPLAQSLRKLQQKDDFTKFSFCLESLYVWASYLDIRWNFKISPPFLYVPWSKLLVCKVSRNSKKNSRPSFEHPKKFQLIFNRFLRSFDLVTDAFNVKNFDSWVPQKETFWVQKNRWIIRGKSCFDNLS